MAEELRYFVRTALFLVVADAIYWFLTYEWAGTLLMGTLAAGAIFFVVAAGRSSPGSALGWSPLRAVDFRDPVGDEHPLEIDDDPIPPASIWPAIAALGGLLLGLGLVYGAWFWMPGVGLSGLAAWGWLTELDLPGGVR